LHFLFDETAGFSAILKMFDYNPNAKLEERDYARTAAWTLRAPMLALSNPDPALAFPPGTTLLPQLLLRNTTAKPIDATVRFNWRSAASTGKAPGPAMRLAPYETRRIDVAALQGAAILPKEANWTSVIITTNSKPDELMAVAASYDSTLRYGAQTPFSDQLTFRWEGGMWEYDPYHSSIITAGNGGTKPTQAAFTIFYNQGAQRYDLEQTLQPDEQMWIDVGKLIREQVPDKNGKALPQDLTSGSYEFRDLTNTGVGTLFEGKVIYDKTYGHVAYGCAACCGYDQLAAAVMYDPLGVPFQGTAGQQVTAPDMCQGGALADVSDIFWGSWSTANSSIATVDTYGTHSGMLVGSTTSQTHGCLNNNDSLRNCPLKCVLPSGGVNVISATITVHFSGSKTVGTPGDGLTFPSNTTCSQNLGLFNCPGPATWVWNVEIAANVSDDASKWTTKQSYTGRLKGNWKDTQGTLHPFDDPLNVSNDNPNSAFVQQTSGTTVIFWIDAPGHLYTYATNEPIDSLTQVQNFTSAICSTVNTALCFPVSWYLKLVVSPGAVLDTTNSQANFGSASTNF